MGKSQGVGTSASPGETPPPTATHTDNSHNEPKQHTEDYGNYDVPPPSDEDYYAPPEEYYPTDADYANISPPTVEQSDNGRATNSATKKSAPKIKGVTKRDRNARGGDNTKNKKD